MQKINQDLTNTSLLDELKLVTFIQGYTQITRASNVKFYQKSVKSLKDTCPSTFKHPNYMSLKINQIKKNINMVLQTIRLYSETHLGSVHIAVH
jgi:hypothetical protein